MERMITKIRAPYVIVMGAAGSGRELYYRGPEHSEVIAVDMERGVATIADDADQAAAAQRWESLPVQNR